MNAPVNGNETTPVVEPTDGNETAPAVEPTDGNETTPVVEPTDGNGATVQPLDLPEDDIQVPDVNTLNGEIKDIMDDNGLSDAEKLAAIEALEAELNESIEQLSAAAEEIASQKQALATAEGTLAQMQSDLTASEQALAQKESELAGAQASIAALEGQIADLSAQSETDSVALAELEAQLAEAREAYARLEEELNAARAEYERRVAELEAYLLSRELIDGEAYIRTDAGSVIAIESDGVTGVWSYVNSTISGNTVVLSITLDGEELFRSAPIAPGESLEGIELNRALTAGSHEAVAVTTVQDADGSVQCATRMPVVLEVAE